VVTQCVQCVYVLFVVMGNEPMILKVKFETQDTAYTSSTCKDAGCVCGCRASLERSLDATMDG
jgi:hypothetical protein